MMWTERLDHVSSIELTSNNTYTRALIDRKFGLKGHTYGMLAPVYISFALKTCFEEQFLSINHPRKIKNNGIKTTPHTLLHQYLAGPNPSCCCRYMQWTALPRPCIPWSIRACAKLLLIKFPRFVHQTQCKRHKTSTTRSSSGSNTMTTMTSIRPSTTSHMKDTDTITRITSTNKSMPPSMNDSRTSQSFNRTAASWSAMLGSGKAVISTFCSCVEAPIPCSATDVSHSRILLACALSLTP